MKTLIIDNYDSYTFNLYQLVAEVSGEKPIVIKNDEMNLDEILNLKFDNVLISPGPGRPERKEDFGVCEDIITKLDKPILGVCLGQQGIYYLCGGEIELAPKPVHGQLSKVYYNDSGLFKGIEQGFKVTRYHSLVCKPAELETISIDAKTEDGIIMGISHKTKPIYGVQFHPESICTEFGKELIRNFFRLSKEFYDSKNPLDFRKYNFNKDTLDLYHNLLSYDKNTLWLDSSMVNEDLSRFSIFGLTNGKRCKTIKYHVGSQEVTIEYKNQKEVYRGNIFDYFDNNLYEWDFVDEIPCNFQLGYIGYLGYELKKDILVNNKKEYNYPDAYFKYIDRAIIVDHLENEVYVLRYKDDEDFQDKAKELIFEENNLQTDIPTKKELPTISILQDRTTYIKNIEKCKELIKQGESYEICLTNRIDIQDTLDPIRYYEILREISPAPYSALLNFDEISIACSSMERFIKLDKNRIAESKPIKGTIRRGKDQEEDNKLISSLREEEKTKSENLMIVDLLRNDLGKISKIGTVNVPKLMAVETYSTLHQLVTTVQGVLDEEYDAIDLLKGVFPGGSMTGAPKKRTLEIIDELEVCPRGVYSGAIGYISNNKTMDFNIVIRTAVIEKDRTTLGVGGAIVNLSNAEEEFDEILLKAKGALASVKEYYGLDRDLEMEIEGSK